MRFFYLILYTIILTPLYFSAQTIKGRVFSATNKSSLPGANVYWQNTNIGTSTNQNGQFEIEIVNLPEKLISSFVGFKNDTVLVNANNTQEIIFQLEESILLKEVVVTANQPSTFMSMRPAIPIENITSKELKKAACCNLSESFETNASVDVAITDAVSGSKKVQMLGLDGIYTQILFENMPFLRGLSSSNGLNFVPGTWVESMQITKGSGSVVNGYESMAGQINIEFLKPEEHERVFVNLYSNHQQRYEANIHLAQKISKKVSNLLFVHANTVQSKTDMNNDGFYDMPQNKQINIFNRWNINSEKWESKSGVKVMWEDRLSGQTNFNQNLEQKNQSAYGIKINNRLLEGFTKNGFLFPNKPNKSIGTIINGKMHQQEMFFGNRKYIGTEQNINANLIHQSMLFNTFHTLKSGISFMFDEYRENYNDSIFNRTEIVPGIYTEYTYNDELKFSAVAGIRADMHNLYGLRITPRLHLKYNIFKETVLRASVGQGFRVANVFVENSTVFASARTVILKSPLMPENTINTGGSLLHKFTLGGREASFVVDYFYTYFFNQVIIDLDFHPQQVWFYNLNGESYSHSTQAEINFYAFERFEIKAAYKYYSVETTYNGLLLSRPLVPKHRALLGFSYETFNEKWKFDATANYFEKSRLPNTSSNPEIYKRASSSLPYTLLHLQITKVFKHLEAYLGGENLLNFIQPNAIISPNEPFGTYFDASMMWAPVNGRMIYGGIRFKIK
jgi:outer membrane receptor for ferrienterochelin and colicin